MVWAQVILDEFATVPEGDDVAEKEFHGPYSKLLYTIFPADSKYTVVPQYMPTGRGTADFIFTFRILVRKLPVFILELKPPADLRLQSGRMDADDQIRRRLVDLACESIATPSAIGTKLCFYTYTKGSKDPISPSGISYDRIRVNDVAPREWWALDVLEDAGEQRLRIVIGEIKTACAHL
ncbi:hypothetical protein MSAN_01230500 [Mycena sanguinolenta]|uniref:Uncharacterized protein n=1 Tax=Mycena sanguinolenta TaxID=230812 RepID=A0A8H7D4C4_9AGAR|nr:hypothetical protein MSAN_01230500 [Mycena sanguinolenta]